MQLNSVDLVRPGNVPPTQSAFIAYDARQNDPNIRGHVGNVGAVRLCAAGTGFPPVEAGTEGPPVEGAPVEGAAAPPVEGGGGATAPPVEGGGGGTTTPPPVEEGSGGTTTPPPVEGGGGGVTQTGPIVVVKTSTSTCTAKGPCSFKITVTNTTDAEVKGIVIDEQIDAPAAVLTGEPSAGFECTKAAPFTCTLASLPAKSSKDLNLSFTPNTAPAVKQLKNCAVVKSPAPAAPPAPANQLAPGKKSEAPFGGNPLIRYAGFRRPSLHANQSFVHLAGNAAGGNIGGVGPAGANPCRKFLNGGFDIMSNGQSAFSFSELSQSSDGVLTGKLTDFTANGPIIMDVSGSISDTGFHIVTNQNVPLTFDGTIGPDGKVSGQWLLGKPEDGNTPQKFTSGNLPLKCVMNDFCNDFANTAAAISQEFADNKCGTQPPSMSLNAKDHLDWCMAANDHDRATADNVNRQAVVDQCKARNAECDDFAKFMVAANDELKALNCKADDPNLMTLEKLAGLCRLKGLGGVDPDKLKDAEQKKLDACKAQQANATPAPAPPVVPAAVPAPEQCAVVAIDPEAGAAGEPSAAGQLSLVKFGIPGSCKDNRNCGFGINFVNNSDAEFDGDVEFDDTVTGDGATFGASTITSPDGTWQCAKTGQGFKCKGHLLLPGHGSHDLPLTADLGPGIGAVKEMKNCATLKEAPTPSCTTMPLTPPASPVPANALKISKIGDPCTVDAAGVGTCKFAVTITNVGDVPFSGPIEFDDQTLVVGPAGPDAPGAVTAAAPWACTTDQKCSNPDVKLDPQSSTTVQLTAHFKQDAKPICRVDNGVAISIPKPGSPQNAGASAFAFAKSAVPANPACPQPTNLSLKKTATPDCVKNADGNFTCSYKITITNTGPNSFKDSIQILDSLRTPAKDSPLTSFISATPKANWDCQTNAEGLVGCTSKAPVSLDVNKSIDLDLDMVVDKSNATADKCKIANTALILKPIAGEGAIDEGRKDFGSAPENTDPGDDIGTATAKIPLAADANGVVPCDPPSLKLSKAANPQICDKAAGGFRCSYDILITSTGPDPFHGPLTLQDTLPAGSTLEKATGPGWTCSGAGVVQCKHDFVDVPVGQSLGVTVSVLVPEANVKPNACQVTNSVALALASGPLKGQNFNASASATIQSPLCTVPVGPSKLHIDKTGPESCQPGGECRFDLDIFDPGPTDYNAPVTVVDGLSGLEQAQIVSITPAAGADPFPCKPAPTQIPFSCTGAMNMVSGEHDHYAMVVRLPRSAPASGSFKNCAIVSDGTSTNTLPRSGGGKATSGAESVSCHAVKLEPATTPLSPTGQPQLVIQKKATVASCTDAGGGCAFEITVRNTGTGPQSGPITVDETVKADGAVAASANMQSAVNAPWSCTKSGPGRFVCASAEPLDPGKETKLNVTFRLRADTGAKEIENCAQIRGVEGTACAKIPLAAPAGCSGGMILLEGTCACPRGQTWNGRACAEARTPPPDLIPDNRGGASGIIPPPVCPPDRPIGDFPNCCPSGTRFAHGVCHRPSGGSSVGGSTVGKNVGGTKSSRPSDVCPPDRPVGDFPDCCPVGTRFAHGACRRNGGTGPGANGNGGSTTGKNVGGTKSSRPSDVCPANRPIGTFPDCCPTGTHFAHGVCRRSAGGGAGDKGGGTNGNNSTPPGCPANRPIGTPPNCCPTGTHFAHGVCRRSAGGGDGDKRGGTNGNNSNQVCSGERPVGTPPNCCPLRYHLRRRGGKTICSPDQPEPQQQAPSGGTIGPHPTKPCTGGKIGTQPNCRCPAGTHLTRSDQCETNSTPARAPTPAPAPKPKCPAGRPFGTPPNNCCAARDWNPSKGRCEAFTGPR